MSLEVDIFSEEEFEAEKKKFQFLYTNGYISQDQLKLAYNILGITVDPTEVIEFVDNSEEVRLITPVIIIAKPSIYPTLKQSIPNAEVADPYIQKFPAISLLSLEKTINSLATLKIPYKTFTVYLHSSYWNTPANAVELINLLIGLLNQNGYNVAFKTFREFGQVVITIELMKVLCHLKKKLGRNDNCDDNEWWKYDLWGGRSNFIEVDMQRVEKIALKTNVPPSAVKYIILAVLRNKPYTQYLGAFNITEETATKIMEMYFNGN
ncbi:MAG: hypothetical protein RXN93_09325 [Thermocladium sp.]